MSWEPKMLEGYYYYPPFKKAICEECCLGFAEGPYSAIPCPKCKHITGFTMTDKNKILSESMPYFDFTLKVRHYSMGIDIKNKRMVDMDRVFHEHYLEKQKNNGNITADYPGPVPEYEPPKKAVEKKKEQPPPKKEKKKKPEPEPELDFREIALGGLFRDE